VSLASILTAVAGLGLGALLGRRLAARGVTAENALTGRQGLAYSILIAIAAGFALVYFGPRLSLLSWVPTPVTLYGEEAVWPLAGGMAAFALGLLALMEWPGRRVPKRLATLALGSVVMAAALGYLGYRSLPVTGELGAGLVVDGVVMQTTSYTCAPASIATLARAVGLNAGLTERAVVELARTTRKGTTSLSEIRAMGALGLMPRYARRLTPDSLAAAGQPALLHVDEPVAGTTIRHAVALLAVDPAARTVTIGNPLHGVQRKTFEELRGYWIGEAVFVTLAKARASGDIPSPPRR
jgi:predicted double-glycine peptidase